MATIPESSLHRTLRGPMADWDLNALLLRNIALLLAGANWQRSGGKGSKPKPIALPEKTRTGQPAKPKKSGAEIAQRLRNLGLIPAGAAD